EIDQARLPTAPAALDTNSDRCVRNLYELQQPFGILIVLEMVIVFGLDRLVAEATELIGWKLHVMFLLNALRCHDAFRSAGGHRVRVLAGITPRGGGRETKSLAFDLVSRSSGSLISHCLFK